MRTRRKTAPTGTPSMSAEQYRETFADEDAFQTWVVKTARANGWRVFYLPNWMYRLAMASMKRRRIAREWADAGFPDVILLRGARSGKDGKVPAALHVWELKTDKGRASKEQKGWLADFQAVGIAARIVKPSDLPWVKAALRA